MRSAEIAEIEGRISTGITSQELKMLFASLLDEGSIRGKLDNHQSFVEREQ